jgi:XTP/dITP diphosphohydrolase
MRVNLASPPRLLLATTSADKVRELREILGSLPLELPSLRDLGVDLDVEETGRTFQENADLKALAYWHATRLPCLAEDSGFEVDALDGAPGIYSARWEGADYRHKNCLIVERLAGLRGVARRCRYVCAMTLVGPDGRLRHAHGALVGRVAEVPRGSGGFGYDPIFLMPRLGKTLAELEPVEKNARSHRARAARRLVRVVRRLLLPESSQEPSRAGSRD